MIGVYVFDIDGTIADNSHRTHHLLKQPKDWDAYKAGVMGDKAIGHMLELVLDIPSDRVVFCTGRSEWEREATTTWLFNNAFPAGNLYMRKEGDHRPDHIVKRELLDQIRADGFEPIMVFDDRNSVVKMWREAGIPCAQVAEGDF